MMPADFESAPFDHSGNPAQPEGTARELLNVFLGRPSVTRTYFVLEDTSLLKKRLLALAILTLVTVVTGYTIITYIVRHGMITFTTITPLTLLAAGTLSGLFFLPIPLEVMFFAGIRAGTNPVLATIAIILGFTIGNCISYVIGWKLSKLATSLFNAKKVYAVRRTARKYGIYAIIGMNLVPSPSPVLTFGLALAGYPFSRLFVVLVGANIVKFLTLLSVF